MTDEELTLSVYAPPRAEVPWTLAGLAGHERLRVYSLARWALVEALRLASARGRAVLVPDFICREVVASLALSGAEPSYYPVGPDLSLAADPAGLPPAAAILAVDYFGFPQDLEPFLSYSRRSGAVVIEDAAHALLSRDSGGALLGTRAPLGLLSQRKSLLIPNGGALLVNDEGLWPRVSPQLPAAGDGKGAPAFQQRRRMARSLAPLLGGRGMAAMIGTVRGLRRARGGPGQDDDRPEREIALAPEPSADSLRPVSCADPKREVERRRALYELCGRLLSPLGVEPIFPGLPDQAAPYAYPYRAEPKLARQAERRLLSEGLISLPWPDLPSAVRAAAASRIANVHVAHFLW